MSVIGKYTIGASGYVTCSANTKRASKFTAPYDLTAIQMSIAPDSDFGTGEYCRLAIYSDNSGEPDALLGQTLQLEGTGNADIWLRGALESPVPISDGVDYWLAVITSADGSFSYDTVTDNERSNGDTYSDGFADPFGSTSTTSNELAIFASDLVMVVDGAVLQKGGVVLETSGGTKYLVFADYVDPYYYLSIYKDPEGALRLVFAVWEDDIFGSGSTLMWVHAAMDSDDNIHLVTQPSTPKTLDVAHAVFNTGTDTIGAWEEAASFTDDGSYLLNRAHNWIGLESNDIVHIFYVDIVTYHGSDFAQIYHAWDDGGGWETEAISSRPNTYYYDVTGTVRNNDDLEIFYKAITPDYAHAYYNTYSSGSWAGESYYAETQAYPGQPGVIATTGGTVYRYHGDNENDVKENGVDTGYNTHAHDYYRRVSAALSPVDGATRCLFYVTPTNELRLAQNAGAGWTDELLWTGIGRIVCEWAFHNEHQSGEINYMMDTNQDIYFDSYKFPSPIVPQRVPRDRRNVLLRM